MRILLWNFRKKVKFSLIHWLFLKHPTSTLPLVPFEWDHWLFGQAFPRDVKEEILSGWQDTGYLCQVCVYLILRTKFLPVLGTHQHSVSYFMLFWATLGLNGQVFQVTRQKLCPLNSIPTPLYLQKHKESQFSKHQLGNGYIARIAHGGHQTFSLG